MMYPQNETPSLIELYVNTYFLLFKLIMELLRAADVWWEQPGELFQEL